MLQKWRIDFWVKFGGICVDAYSGDWSTTSLMQNDLKKKYPGYPNRHGSNCDHTLTLVEVWLIRLKIHVVTVCHCKNAKTCPDKKRKIFDPRGSIYFRRFAAYRLETFYHINYGFAVGCDQGIAMFVKK